MIYIPTGVLADARKEHSALVIHYPHSRKFRVETELYYAITVSHKVVCYAISGSEEQFAEGYAEMLSHDAARKIADCAETANESDIEAAFAFFLAEGSVYAQAHYKDADLQGKRDYLYLLANGPVTA